MSSSVYLIATHQLPSSPPPQDSPCFQSLLIHFCLTCPCGSCAKCNLSTSCLLLLKFFLLSVFPKIFISVSFLSFSFCFQLHSTYSFSTKIPPMLPTMISSTLFSHNCYPIPAFCCGSLPLLLLLY